MLDNCTNHQVIESIERFADGGISGSLILPSEQTPTWNDYDKSLDIVAIKRNVKFSQA